MQFDETKLNIVYPSWAKFSYEWKNLGKLLADPLATPYLKQRSKDNWFGLGYSKQTRNFELIDGPFGNGIIRKDNSVMTDGRDIHAWLPSIILGAESNWDYPPGLSILEGSKYCVSYLSPKPSGEVKLGLKREKEDPLPHFSVEPLAGLDNCALFCVGRTGSSALTEELEQLPAFFRAFEIKAELLDAEDNPTIQKCKGIHSFFEKYKLNGTWYFLDCSGYNDAGLLFAIIVYLGGYLRSAIGSRVKSCHLVTTLPPQYPPMCGNWHMMKLR